MSGKPPTDSDRLVLKKAMDIVLKSPKPMGEMEDEVRQFLRSAKADGASKHTPGPWRVEEGPYFSAIRADAAGVSGIASIQMVSPSTAQATANAHLISAAPDMLFVLKEVEWAADGYDALGWTVACCPFCGAIKSGGKHYDFCNLRAAIDKAERSK